MSIPKTDIAKLLPPTFSTQSYDRNQRIKYILETHPEIPYIQIANFFNVHFSWIYKIRKKNNLPLRQRRQFIYTKQKLCIYCRNSVIHQKARYCTPLCKNSAITIYIPCLVCGILKKLPATEIRSQVKRFNQLHFYCSRKCYGISKIITYRRQIQKQRGHS